MSMTDERIDELAKELEMDRVHYLCNLIDGGLDYKQKLHIEVRGHEDEKIIRDNYLDGYNPNEPNG